MPTADREHMKQTSTEESESAVQSNRDQTVDERGGDEGFDLHAGTTQFYEDPHYYDYEFKSRREDVKYYTDRYLEAGGWCVELGVGTGRIAAPAVRAGAKVIGVDLHEGMLRVAEERRQRLAKAKRGSLRLVQGDMRTFELGETFPLISLPFNALQHMYTLEDARACLKTVHEHLQPGGLLVFDVLMPDFEYLNRPAFARFQGVDFKHPTWGATYNYSEQSAYDHLRQLNQVWFYYDRVDPPIGEPSEAPEHHSIQLSHRYYYPQELALLLEVSGFKTLHCSGDFEGGPVVEGNESLVYICEKIN